VHNAIIDPDLLVHGSSQSAGIKEGTARIKDIFGIGAADVTFSYRFEQLATPFRIEPITMESPSGADVPIIINDSLGMTGITTITPYSTAEREVLVEFLSGGVDTLHAFFGIILPYLDVQLRDAVSGTVYQSDVDWTLTSRVIRSSGGQSMVGRLNRYYFSGSVPNGQSYDVGHLLQFYESKIAFDFPDRGIGSGKAPPLFNWASGHRAGTRDFQAGDRVRVKWQGGVRATFPRNALVGLVGAPPGRVDVTDEMMDRIRIVPNPYLIRHEAQRGEPRVYFNYLPEECTIRIYTVALDLVKTIVHRGGSREEWDLTTEGGQLVASQLLIVQIEALNGKETVKKFAVVIGE